MNIALAPFTTLYRHRSLLWQFSLRAVELRHKGSHLGFIWAVLSPLMMLALYVLVFGFIFGGKFGVVENETAIDYGLGIFLGLAYFNFASDIFTVAPSIVSDQTNFVKKVVFPLEILPVAHVFASIVHLLITVGLVFAGALLFGRGLPWTCAWFPFLLFPMVLAGMGLAWFLSALGVFLKDIRQLMPAIVTGLMFASAVFYAPARIPLAAWKFMKFNPLLQAIAMTRSTVLWGDPIDWKTLACLYITGFVMLQAGYWTFQKLKPAFGDVI